MNKLNEILSEIAQKHLGIPTLETRKSDRLDFHDVAVWSVRDALAAAFESGAQSRSGALELAHEPARTMKQQVDIRLKLSLWIDATMSKDELAALVELRMRNAFAREIEEALCPLTILELKEEAEIYSADLPTRFDDYEIQPCRRYIVEDEPDKSFVEPCESFEADFWTLYGHIPKEGVQTIGDFDTHDHAEEVFARITGQRYTGKATTRKRT